MTSPTLQQATEHVQSLLGEKAAYKEAKAEQLPIIDFYSPGKYCSQYWIFDLDLKDNPGLDLEQLKEKLKQNVSIALFFSSPGGGLKIVSRVNCPLSDFEYRYSQHQASLEQSYSIKLDRAQRNNCSYLCYSPGSYINQEARVWEYEPLPAAPVASTTLPSSSSPAAHRTTVISLRSKRKAKLSGGYRGLAQSQQSLAWKVETIAANLLASKKSITQDYVAWVRVGYALLNTFNHSTAKSLFHTLSRVDRSYNAEECSKTFSYLVESWRNQEGPTHRKASFRGAIIEPAVRAGAWEDMRGLEQILQPFMPGKHRTTKAAQARALNWIYLRCTEPGQAGHKYGEFTRINAEAIAEALGLGRRTVANYIQALQQADLLDLVQPFINQPGSYTCKDQSYFATLSPVFWDLLTDLYEKKAQPTKNGLSSDSGQMANFATINIKGGGNSLNDLSFKKSKEEKRKEHITLEEVPAEKIAPTEVERTSQPAEQKKTACTQVEKYPTSSRSGKSRVIYYPTPLERKERTKPKPANQPKTPVHSEEIRRKYQAFLQEVRKYVRFHKDSKADQRIFAELYTQYGQILAYLPIFFERSPGRPVHHYLKYKKWEQYAAQAVNKQAQAADMPKNNQEARELNERYQICDLLLKHKYLPCLILNGKKQKPSRVPDGLAYMHKGQYFVNQAGLQQPWLPEKSD